MTKCHDKYIIQLNQMKGVDKMSPRNGRPPSEDPKSHRESFRLSDDDMMKLNYCMEKTGMKKTEVIRKGIEMVYNELKKE